MSTQNSSQEVSYGKHSKLSKVWSKIKGFVAPIGAILLAIFAFIGGKSVNKRTVSKLQELNRRLIRDTERLADTNRQLKRLLEEQQRTLEERRGNIQLLQENLEERQRNDRRIAESIAGLRKIGERLKVKIERDRKSQWKIENK